MHDYLIDSLSLFFALSRISRLLHVMTHQKTELAALFLLLRSAPIRVRVWILLHRIQLAHILSHVVGSLRIMERDRERHHTRITLAVRRVILLIKFTQNFGHVCCLTLLLIKFLLFLVSSLVLRCHLYLTYCLISFSGAFFAFWDGSFFVFVWIIVAYLTCPVDNNSSLLLV